MEKQKRYFVYRFKNKDNVILYVGRTVNLIQRFKQHDALSSDVTKIEYIECTTEAEMVWKEIYYINLYYNELSKNISDVYQNKNMKTIDLKDIWKEYTYFNYLKSDKSDVLYEKYIIKKSYPSLNYKELITIVEHEKLNIIGNGKYALSEKWFRDNPKKVKTLKNHVLNYFNNIIKDTNKTKKCLWITYIEHFDSLKEKGIQRDIFIEIIKQIMMTKYTWLI